MGKGDKPAKASSARAAEALASKAGTGFGFGGFTGAQAVSATVPGFGFGASVASAFGSNQADSEPVISSALDGEVAKYLKHLSKQDPTTKLKALQGLKALVPQQSQTDAVAALPPWIYVYRRLVMDNNRSVRSQANEVHGSLLTVVGKQMAPHLKSMIGPWWLAQFDPYADASNAAKSAFQAMFPGRKQTDALGFCRKELIDYLQETLASNAQQLGDARKETPEELEERHERVVGSALLAVAAIVELMVPPGTTAGTSGTAADGSSVTAEVMAAELAQDVEARVASFIQKPGFIKGVVTNKSARIRRCAYGMIKSLVASKPSLLAVAAIQTEVASAVLGAIQDKEPANHPAMWGMILGYAQAVPEGIALANLRKAVLPRLYAFLRHSCYGSATSSYPALLPFVAQLPSSCLGPQPDVLLQVLDAIWAGLSELTSRPAKVAAATAYKEVLQWALQNSNSLATADQATATAEPAFTETVAAVTYCEQLLEGSLIKHVLAASLGGSRSSNADVASDVLQSVVVNTLMSAASRSGCSLPSDMQTLQAATALGPAVQAVGSCLAAAVAGAVSACISVDKGSGSHLYAQATMDGCEAVLLELKGKLESICPELSMKLAAAAASSITSAMSHDAASLPPEASKLLANLIREFGAGITTGGTLGTGNIHASASFNAESLLRTYATLSPTDPSAEHQADLLVSFLQSQPKPELDHAWSEVLFGVLSASPADAPAVIGSGIGVVGSNAVQFEGIPLTTHGLKLAQLLLQRLASTFPAASLHSWSCSTLDALICHLVSSYAATAAAASALADDDASVVATAVPTASYSSYSHMDAAIAESDATAIALSACALTARALASNVSGACLLSLDASKTTLDRLAASLDACVSVISTQHQRVVTEEEGEHLAQSASWALQVIGGTAGGKNAAVWQTCSAEMVSVMKSICQLSWAVPPDASHFADRVEAHEHSSDDEADLSDHESVEAEPEQPIQSTVQSEQHLPASADSSASSRSATRIPDCILEVATSASQILTSKKLLATAVASLPTPSKDHLINDLTGILAAGIADSAASVVDREAAGKVVQPAVAWALYCSQVIAATASTADRQAVIDKVLQCLSWTRWGLPGPRVHTHKEAGSSCSAETHSYMLQLVVAMLQHGGMSVMVLDDSSDKDRDLSAAASSSMSQHGSSTGNQSSSTAQHPSSSTQHAGAVLHQAGSSSRVWVLVELVCSLHAGADFLSSSIQAALKYLVKQLEVPDKAAAAAAAYTCLLDSLARGCSSSSSGSTDGSSSSSSSSNSQVWQQALLHVLQLLSHKALHHDEAVAELLYNFGHEWLLPCVPARSAEEECLDVQVAVKVLPVLTPVFRATSEALDASAIGDLTRTWIVHSLNTTAVSVDPSDESLQALQMVLATFAASGQLPNSQGQLHAWDREKELLVKLLRHQALRHAAAAAARRFADSAIDESRLDTAKALVLELAVQAATYNPAALTQSDWQAVLQDAQAQLAAASEGMLQLLLHLATAISAAADTVLASATSTPGPMALQLLRKLNERGVLSQHAAFGQLLSSFQDALTQHGVMPAGLQPAAVAAARVMQIQSSGSPAEAVAALGNLREATAECCGHMLCMASVMGGVECYSHVAGAEAVAAVAAWQQQYKAAWEAVATAGGLAVADQSRYVRQAVTTTLGDLEQQLDGTGLDISVCLLAVALQPSASVLQPLAYQLLLDPQLLPRLTFAESVMAESADNSLPEYDASSDATAYLVSAGMRPELASALTLGLQSQTGTSSSSTTMQLSTAQRRQYFTAWALLLAHLVSLPHDSLGSSALRQALREIPTLVPKLLDTVLPYLPLQTTGGKQAPRMSAMEAASSDAISHLARDLQQTGAPVDMPSTRALAVLLYRAVLHALPASARTWFCDLRDRAAAQALEAYTAAVESPALVGAEISSIQAAGPEYSSDNFSVRANASTREVIAVMEVEDGASLELLVKLPAALPLKAAEVECRRKVGVNETRLRKWLLSMSAFLRNQNQGVAHAIALWKRNLDKEFEGLEPCLICYSIVSATNNALPKLQCRTCSQRFHPACLYKWFKSSGKSQCPHCQSPW